MKFYFRLIFKLIFDFFQLKEINLDYEKFDAQNLKSKLRSKCSFSKISKIRRYLYGCLIKVKNLISIKSIILKSKQISYLYYLLEDIYSKKKIIELLSGYILGFRFVKLSLNNNLYWKIRENVKNLTVNNEYIRFGRWNLNLFDLYKVRIPIKLFSLSSNILNTFLLEQYYYKHNEIVWVKEGDYVLDAGGCWGDTALYFANKVGYLGKVYSFEFISKNLNVFKRNLNLNMELQKRIEIIELPLWKSPNNYYM